MRKLLALVLSISLLVSACKVDEPASVGGGVIDANSKPGAGYSDTLIPLAFTAPMLPVSTNGDEVDLLGSYLDPVFGYVEASFVTSFQLSSDEPIGADNALEGTFDSIVVVIQYFDNNFYGSKNDSVLDKQTIEVFKYEVEVEDITYKSDVDISDHFDDTKLLGAISIVPDPTTSEIRIRLDSAFGKRLFDEMVSFGDLPTNEQLKGVLKGLYIRSNNTGQISGHGSIQYMNFQDENSSLAIYYTTTEGTVKFDLESRNQSHRFNIISHDFDGYIDFTNTLVTNDLLYLQALEGTEVIVRLDNKISFQDSATSAINKAIIDFQVNSIYSEGYEPPSTLIGFELNSDGVLGASSQYVSGELLSIESKQNTGGTTGSYQFDIREYVEKVANGDIEDNGILITVNDVDESANRVVLNGFSQGLDDRSRIIITYTTP
ncbi:MAG: DUF4270 family protein [Flavobacteriales bacterium]|nr:DUF4270 family protein [Flavobacteriales bacterium]